MSDVADRLREIADKIDGGIGNELPEFSGYQMVEEVTGDSEFSVYVDEDGDVWVHHEPSEDRYAMTTIGGWPSLKDAVERHNE